MADNIEAVGLEFDTRAYEAAIRRAERRLDDLEDSVDRSTRSAKRQEDQFLRNARAVVGLVAAYGGFRILQRVGRFTFDTIREFETLEARLVSITGSTGEAAASFKLITDFARTTPFEVANLTQAFTTLQAAGIQPTAEMLRGIGNFAAAMGRDITDAVEAILRASQGGTERLRESFFIPISKQGEDLVISFRGVTQRVSADAATLIDFFTDLGETQFGDGMERQMNTIDGAMSNLADTASLLAKEIGDAGLASEMTALTREIDAVIASADGMADLLGTTLAGVLREVIELGKEWVLILNAIGGESGTVAGTKLSLANASEGALRDRLDEFTRLRDAAPLDATRFSLGGDDSVSRIGLNKLIRFIEGRLADIEAAGSGPVPTGRPDPSGGGSALSAREDEARRLVAEQQRLLDTQARIFTSLEKERIALEEGEEAAFGFSLAVQDITGATQDGLVAKFEHVRAIEREQEAAKRLADEAFARLEAEYQQLANAADRMAQSVTDAFLDMGDGAFDLLDSIGEAVDGIIREFARLAVRRGITQPLTDAFLGVLNGGIPDAPEPIPEPLNPLTLSPRGSSGAVVVNAVQNVSVNAIDTRTGAEFIRQQKGAILAQFAEGLQESTVLQGMARRR